MQSRTMKKVGRGLFACAVVSVCALGLDTTAVAKPPKGGGPIYCLDVWRPVICPNGQVYSNDCYALRAGQVGCVPWGGDVM